MSGVDKKNNVERKAEKKTVAKVEAKPEAKPEKVEKPKKHVNVATEPAVAAVTEEAEVKKTAGHKRKTKPVEPEEVKPETKPVEEPTVQAPPAQAEPEAEAEEQTKKRRRRGGDNADVGNAKDGLRDLAENGEEMSLEERFNSIVACSNILTECFSTMHQELRAFGRVLNRHEKVSRKQLQQARNTRTRRQVNPDHKHTSSGFVCPVPVPQSLLAFVDMGRDPTPADTLEPKKKVTRENWWENNRWLNVSNNTCWRLESNEPGAAKWVPCERMEVSHPQVISSISRYVTANNLKSENNGSVFTPDAALRTLLGEPRYKLASSEENGYAFSNLARYVSDVLKGRV